MSIFKFASSKGTNTVHKKYAVIGFVLSLSFSLYFTYFVLYNALATGSNGFAEALLLLVIVSLVFSVITSVLFFFVSKLAKSHVLKICILLAVGFGFYFLIVSRFSLG